MMEKRKRVWEIPLLITLFAMLVGSVFGIRGACFSCEESREKSLRKMAVSKAMGDYSCGEVRFVSGDQETGIYQVNVCGTKRWYKCRRSHTAPFSCVPRCKKMRSVR